MKTIYLLFPIFYFLTSISFSINKESLAIGECYVFRLANGDVIQGEIKSITKDEDGEVVILESDIVFAEFNLSEIADAWKCINFYRNGHKYFLLPSAIGIGENHFVGVMELFFLYSGIGITDYFSIIGGRTMLPLSYPGQQISLLNIKGSFPKIVFEDIFRELHLAFGGNLGFANNSNRFLHIYGVATALFYKSSLSACLFYKMGAEDFYFVRFGPNVLEVNYPNGAFGVSLGLDTRLPKFKDVHIIGELWNIDISRPTHSGLFLGIRIANTTFCSDFGLCFFSHPYVVPFVNFVWTPF